MPGCQSRTVKPQWAANAAKVLLSRALPAASRAIPSTTVRIRSYSSVWQLPPKCSNARSCADNKFSMRSFRYPSAYPRRL